uniref:Sorbin and SH3 domain containing 3 n=1 Tax=Phasianus colchicus TaxID=9054 RepID=A0A669QMF7_PHACC
MEGAAPPPGCSATWMEDGRRRERRWVKYDGIGPVDETGLPLASRSSVDQPRDWYRRMFQQIHGKLPGECRMALPGAMRHNMAQYGTIWLCMAQYGTAWHCMAQYGTVQLQRELEQLSAELDEDIRAMERPQRVVGLGAWGWGHLGTRGAGDTQCHAGLGTLGDGRCVLWPLSAPCCRRRRELPLRRGDVVLLHGAVDANWLRGEHRGRVGIFPRTYVELLPTGEAPQRGTPTAPQGRATAVFSFRGELPIELSFRRGEQLSLLRRVDAHWYEGQIVGTGRRGIAPRCYLRVHCEPGGGPTTPQPPAPQGQPYMASPFSPHSPHLQEDPPHTPSPPPPTSAPRSDGPRKSGGCRRPAVGSAPPALWLLCRHRALYEYRPQNGDELELREGDRVDVLQCCDDGWFVGVSQRTQKFGTFPGNYVAPL